jgi:hypothetical protein
MLRCVTLVPFPRNQALLGPEFPLPLSEPFSAVQASAAGLSRGVVSRLVRGGYLRRILKGVYVATQTPDGLALRAKALLLVVPPHAVITDWTAVWLFTGLLPPNAHLELPAIDMFLPAGKGRLRNRLCDSGEREFLPGDLMIVGGLTVTTPLRTAWDMGRLEHRDRAFSALDAMLAYEPDMREEMVGGVERFRRRRGVVQLRELAPLADGRAESPGESVLRLRWLDLTSLPRPTPQVPILGDDGRELYRLDLGVPELRFGAEYDGEAFHSSDADRSHDEARRDWISQERGWLVTPVRRHNVFGPTRDIEEILYTGVDDARRRLGVYRP